jgi:hypothetical protein
VAAAGARQGKREAGFREGTLQLASVAHVRTVRRHMHRVSTHLYERLMSETWSERRGAVPCNRRAVGSFCTPMRLRTRAVRVNTWSAAVLHVVCRQRLGGQRQGVRPRLQTGADDRAATRLPWPLSLTISLMSIFVAKMHTVLRCWGARRAAGASAAGKSNALSSSRRASPRTRSALHDMSMKLADAIEHRERQALPQLKSRKKRRVNCLTLAATPLAGIARPCAHDEADEGLIRLALQDGQAIARDATCTTMPYTR